jgi:hypothetical protein
MGKATHDVGEECKHHGSEVWWSTKSTSHRQECRKHSTNMSGSTGKEVEIDKNKNASWLPTKTQSANKLQKEQNGR